MEENTAIIELKFDVGNIKPSVVKVSAVAELIKSFEGAVEAVIRHNHPEIRHGYVFMSFDQIRHESLTIRCIAHKANEYVIPAYSTIISAFRSGNFNNLPSSSIEELRKIIRFTRKYNCDGSFISEGKQVANFNTDTDVSYSHDYVLRGETTLYGEVIKVGGDNPRVQVKVNNEYIIGFDVKKEIAIYLAAQLYKEIGLRGIARWDKTTNRIIDFKVDSVIDVETQNLNRTFEELNHLFGDYFQGDVNAFIA